MATIETQVYGQSFTATLTLGPDFRINRPIVNEYLPYMTVFDFLEVPYMCFPGLRKFPLYVIYLGISCTAGSFTNSNKQLVSVEFSTRIIPLLIDHITLNVSTTYPDCMWFVYF